MMTIITSQKHSPSLSLHHRKRWRAPSSATTSNTSSRGERSGEAGEKERSTGCPCCTATLLHCCTAALTLLIEFIYVFIALYITAQSPSALCDPHFLRGPGRQAAQHAGKMQVCGSPCHYQCHLVHSMQAAVLPT